MTVPTSNWAGNVAYRAARRHRPSTVDELRQIVAGAVRIRALGTGHSFSDLAAVPGGDLVSTAGLPRVMDIDTAAAAVTVSAGVRYAELAEHLHAAGVALPNLASLPHICVAGACATGTHGSGDRLGNLATAVSMVELVTADGGLVELRRGTDRFAGAVVGLGMPGIATRLTLDLVPAFDVAQYVYDGLPRHQLDEHLAEILAAAYSVSVFTDWAGATAVWLKHRVDEPPRWPVSQPWLGAVPADGPRHPVAGMPPAACTEQLGVPGPWYARLPHFRPGSTPSSEAELQSEYLVPRERAVEAIAALDGIRHRIAALVQISEIRTVAADDLWLSPSYRRGSVAIHFTWRPHVPAVTELLAAVEERLDPFEARPHWGKLFRTEAATLRRRYPRWADFVGLARAYDPAGRFRNELIERYFPVGC